VACLNDQIGANGMKWANLALGSLLTRLAHFALVFDSSPDFSGRD
jgi:hypothetical protein